MNDIAHQPLVSWSMALYVETSDDYNVSSFLAYHQVAILAANIAKTKSKNKIGDRTQPRQRVVSRASTYLT